jgi:hypothetical protein
MPERASAAATRTAPTVHKEVNHGRIRRKEVHSAVMADLAVLAQYQMPHAPTPRVSVTAPSGGLWCGDAMRFNGLDGVESLILAVRTFRSADRFY